MSNKWMIQDWTTGELNALVKNLGGEEVARKIQREEIKVSFEDVVKVLFDKHGRRIPKGLKANVCDANRNFRLDQPKLETKVDYNRITRLHECLNIDTGITAEQFKSETERLLAIIRDNTQVANITNGVWLPVVLPKLITDDLGTELGLYLEAVGNSYTKTFSDRKFYNHRKGTLGGNVSIIDGSRYDQLIERMKQGPVIGIHFPNPLQGFSINAQREQMSTLPEGFILSGLDTAIAMVMYPDILACKYNTSGLDLPALQWQSVDYSLCFGADDDELGFGSDFLAIADGDFSGGLLFLG